jgi:hypothetical protein
MKNIGNIAGKAAVALSFLSLGASAKAMEEYNKSELKTKTELANFDIKLKKESVSNKVIDTLNPAKSAAKETLNADPTPEQIAAAEILTNKFAELTRKQANEYLTQNSADLDKKVLEIVVINLDKRWSKARRLANLYSNDARNVPNVYSDEDQAAKQQKYFEKRDTYKAEYGRLGDVIYEVEQAIERKSLPTAEELANGSQIENKTSEIIKWEKTHQMEIAVEEEFDMLTFIVKHNGESVSSIAYASDVKSYSLALKENKYYLSLNYTDNTESLLTYNEKDGKIIKQSTNSQTRTLFTLNKNTVEISHKD